ncbi:MAG TPA: C26 family cysteine hydrolase domain-containing family, partial [Firmicutes bacterium]|nr:C26 family cysteine hydrolase domain-containing family [Bacillota bacterium]
QSSPRCYPSHTITITADSRLSTITGEEVLPVNSFHHQAVEHVAPGFQKTALAPDGVVEALESCRHRFVLGLQWHPEALADPSSPAIFLELVKAAEGKGTDLQA